MLCINAFLTSHEPLHILQKQLEKNQYEKKKKPVSAAVLKIPNPAF